MEKFNSRFYVFILASRTRTQQPQTQQQAGDEAELGGAGQPSARCLIRAVSSWTWS